MKQFFDLIDENNWAFLAVIFFAAWMISMLQRRAEKKYWSNVFERVRKLKKMRGDL